jgi:hypothetical protein
MSRECGRDSKRDSRSVAEGAVRDSLLLAWTGGSKEEPRPEASQPLTRPLIRASGGLGATPHIAAQRLSVLKSRERFGRKLELE